jgi:hypothetical protein
MVPAALAAIVQPLLANGLGLVANAVMAKGQQYVEDKLGVKLAPNMTPEQIAQLKVAEMEHEQELMRLRLEENKLDIEAFKAESAAITDRWKADMASDSWLSKNIRPMTLIAIFAAYFLFALMSAFGMDAKENYVTLLGNWGQIVMLAYFGGRTVEKVMEIKQR